MPRDCIFRVISETRDRVLFERISTPRPAPKVILKSNWLVQQQQPICNEVVTGTSKVVAKWESQSGTRDGTRDVRGFSTGTGNSSGKPVQDPDPKVEQKPDVDIDLRVQRAAQTAILQDEAKIREINKQVNKIKSWIKQDFYSQRLDERWDIQ